MENSVFVHYQQLTGAYIFGTRKLRLVRDKQKKKKNPIFFSFVGICGLVTRARAYEFIDLVWKKSHDKIRLGEFVETGNSHIIKKISTIKL
jgi:hypothetical protein